MDRELSSNPSSDTTKTYSRLWEVILAGEKDANVLRVLLNFRNDPNEKLSHGPEEYRGFTMLEYIASRPDPQGNVEIAKVLIDGGADVNEGNPLEKALIDCVDIELVKLFLENGASVSGMQQKISPAVYTFNNSSETVCKEILLQLIKHGLDVHYRNELGQNLLHIYSQGYCVYDENFTFTKWKARVEIAKILLKAKVELNVLDNNGVSPLHNAVRESAVNLVSLFIDNGADVNVYCKYYDSFPLTVSFENEECSVDIVDLLLKAGADVNAKNSKGHTALHLAYLYGHDRIISLLIQNGADTFAVDNNGKTPIASFGFKNCSKCA